MNHFKPEELKEEVTEEVSKELPSTQNNQEGNEENKEMSESDSSKGAEEEIEVIRMPKIKLEGVKVVGKIDLPDPVKKDNTEDRSIKQQKDKEDIPAMGIDGKYKKTRKRSPGKKFKHRNSRKELSYEEKLKREERKKVREQQKAKKLKKEQKKKHYLKNVQSNIESTSRKKKNRKSENLELEAIKPRPEYKNPIRKFWGWLNGEYDR